MAIITARFIRRLPPMQIFHSFLFYSQVGTMKTERKDISALAANLRSADDRERYNRVISISQNLQRQIQDLSASRYRYRQPIFMEERRRHHNGNSRTGKHRYSL